MDKRTRYRDIVRDVIRWYADHKPANGTIDTELVYDPARDHFEVLSLGWQEHRRVHGTVVHVDLIEDKVWVQHDSTNRPVAEALADAGIPKEDIVLGFYPPDVRPHTGFGVG